MPTPEDDGGSHVSCSMLCATVLSQIRLRNTKTKHLIAELKVE